MRIQPTKLLSPAIQFIKYPEQSMRSIGRWIGAGVALLAGGLLVVARQLYNSTGVLLMFLLFSLAVSAFSIDHRTVNLWLYSATDQPEHLRAVLTQYLEKGDTERLSSIYWAEYLRNPSEEFFTVVYPLTIQRELAEQSLVIAQEQYQAHNTTIEVAASFTTLAHQLGKMDELTIGLNQWRYLDPSDSRTLQFSK